MAQADGDPPWSGSAVAQALLLLSRRLSEIESTFTRIDLAFQELRNRVDTLEYQVRHIIIAVRPNVPPPSDSADELLSDDDIDEIEDITDGIQALNR